MEDYLEAIYNLNQEKGYIATSDISDRLGVTPPTVSNMVTKLAEEGYLVHEKYRGMKLTESGVKLARSVIRRHQTVFDFLSMLGIGKEIAYEDTEGIEHHLHPITLYKFGRLVDFLRENPLYLEKFKEAIGEGQQNSL